MSKFLWNKDSVFKWTQNLSTDIIGLIYSLTDRSSKSSYFPDLEKDLPLNKRIDHTLLKTDTTIDEIERLCDEAKEFNFFSVCVSPLFVKNAREFLEGSNVKTITVIGFPSGQTPLLSKVFETKTAIQDGAQEIDMVLHIGALKSKDYRYVLKDIQSVVEAAHPHYVKVILETCLLTNEEKIIACALAKAAGAHYVKTSTGFSTGGATLEDIKLMRGIVGENCGVKASGGIKTFEQANAFIQAGASRLGTSSGIEIVKKIMDKKNKSEKKNESYS